jgi:hypothetical protein
LARRRPPLRQSLGPVAAAAAALAAFVLPPAALGGAVTKSKSANLDRDAALERVVPEQVCETAATGANVSACGPGQFAQRRIVIEDTCKGVRYSRVVSTEQDAVIKLVVSNFEDVTPRPEIFFDLRSGAGGRVGEVRIVSWEEGTPPACPNARMLFRYPSRRTLGRVPRGAKSHDTFDATLRDVTKRYGGKEVRLRETYVDANDALCCPSFERVTWFGYNAGKDLYVRLRTHVKRIRK